MDYGTDSARAIVVNARTGEEVATGKYYPRWVEGECIRPEPIPSAPLDYIEVLEASIRMPVDVSGETAKNVIGIAFDTTGSTRRLP